MPRNRGAGDWHENIEPRAAGRKAINATRDSYRKWAGELGGAAGDLLMEATTLRSRFTTDEEHAVTLARFGGDGVVAWLLNSIDDFGGIARVIFIAATGSFDASRNNGLCLF